MQNKGKQLKELIGNIYKDEIVGTISLKVSSDKEVLINKNEIALAEFEIVEC